MSKDQTAVADGKKKPFLHMLFGSTPGDGEMQPKEGISYSLCGFGQNLICTVIGSYLTVFMTDAIGFSALAVALLMLFARIFDALNDPIMGSIVDRTRTKWGKCRPYMKWMAFPIAAMTVICFLPWYPNNDGGFAALSIMYIVWGIIYTVADVPYWGLSTAMSNDTYRRGNLLTIARLFCTAGAGIVTVFVPIITSNATAEWQTTLSTAQNLSTAIESTKTEENAAGIDLETVKQNLSVMIEDVPNIDNVKDFDLNAKIATAIKYIDSDDESITAIRNYITALNVAENLDGDAYNFIVEKDGKITLRSPGEALLNMLGMDATLDKSSLDEIVTANKAQIQHKLKYIYFIVAIVCCVIALPLFFLGFKQTKERNQSFEEPPSLKHNLKLLFKNKPLMLIVLSGIGGAARMLFTYTGGLYFAKYVLADVSILGGFLKGEGLYTLFTLAVVPGGLIASLLVPYFTKKFGKRNTYIWSHIIGGVAMLIAFIVGMTTSRGDYTGIACIVCLVIALVIGGIPQGFGNILTYAMIGDTVEYLELKTGERAEGICFAMQTLINKIGMAVGAFVGVLAYYLAGVEANNPDTLSATNKDTMWIMLVLIAAISFFLTVIPLFFYKFNEKQQQEAVAEINRRKAALAGENAENGAVETDALGAATDGYAPMEIFPNEDGVAVPLEETEISEENGEAVNDEASKEEIPSENETPPEENQQESEIPTVEDPSDNSDPIAEAADNETPVAEVEAPTEDEVSEDADSVTETPADDNSEDKE